MICSPVVQQVGERGIHLSIFEPELRIQVQKVGCVAQLAERRSLAGELTLSCARPAADG